MGHWTNKYFGSLYHEIYSTYLLDPQRALDEAAFAAQVLDLGRRTVLDLACGYGRHSRLLASSNKVYALDNNGDYLRVMREEMPHRMARNLLPLQGDMRQVPLRDKSVDAAIMLFNSFGYFDAGDDDAEPEPVAPKAGGQVWKLPSVFYERQLVDPSFGRFKDPAVGESADNAVEIDTGSANGNNSWENLLVLKETLRVLKPGGGLLLEIPNRRLLLEAVEENPRRLMVMENAEVHEEFEWDSARNRLLNRTRFVSGDRTEAATYSLRLYEPAELKQLVKEAGFRIQRTFGDYEGGRFGPASSDVLLVHATRPSRQRQ
jgi:ubiquinone/menaquinone biosynthesis C-methylase UbiE